MITDIGYFSLLLAFTLSAYALMSLSWGVKQKQNNLITSGKNALYAVTGLIFASYLALVYAFIIDDFSVNFVATHSSSDLPIFYKVTASWGGMDGSLLFWATVLAFYVSLIIYKYRRVYAEVLPYILIIFSGILLFLLFLLVGWSNPLARLYPIPLEGTGLNPLLQDFAMIIHPPLLYFGFIGMSVPFAFGVGTLLAQRFDNDWILLIRRWTLVGWFFLTCGMIIGGQWAYYELGWGGYWAWDPVENSSLMPWLTATAFLHSSMVQEKRNVLKIWNLILVITTFLLTFVGTFITRSGVLNSVHAFAQSEIGPAFLVFIAIVFIFSFGLLIYRVPFLETKPFGGNLFCKENAFLVNNLFFSGIAFSVFYGTIFPLLAEGLADKKLSIQAPFFNSINTPFAMVLLTLMGITPFLAWKKGNLSSVRRHLMLPGIISGCIIVFTYFFILKSWSLSLMYGILYFSFHAIVLELYKTSLTGLRSQRATEGEGVLKSGIFKNRRKWGAMIVHIAVLTAFLGFCGNFFSIQEDFTIQMGEKRPFGDYTLFYEKAEQRQVRNAVHRAAIIQIFEGERLVSVLKPAKAFYPTTDEPTTEVAIFRNWKEDVYLSLASINEDDSATVTAYINPMIMLVQVSGILFLLGTLLSCSYQSGKVQHLRKMALSQAQRERKTADSKVLPNYRGTDKCVEPSQE